MRAIPAAISGMVLLLGCGVDSTFVGDSNLLTGTYTAQFFLITPDGEPARDILLANGSLTISFDRNGRTAGSLVLPAGVPGGPATLPMIGTATISGLTVEFNQTANSFVNQVTWNRIEGTIQIANTRVGAAVYDVTLARKP